jgi:hypothetical protein
MAVNLQLFPLVVILSLYNCSTMRSLSIIIACAFFVLSCDQRKNQEAKTTPTATLSPRPPEPIEKAILKEFPGAVPVGIFADTLFKQLADR